MAVTDLSSKQRLTTDDLDRLVAIAEGTYTPPPKAKFDLEADALFGGISRLILPSGDYEIVPGLKLVSTFAHVMAPFILAFAPPERPTAPHPGPWAVLQGRGVDVTTEVQLAAGSIPLGFDRLNTLWFVVALLRLRLARPLQMLVLADRTLISIPAVAEIANLLPVEIDHAGALRTAQMRASEDDLGWLSEHIRRADRLMRQLAFNRAFQTLDQAWAVNSPGAGIVIVWASIETLIRPGSQRITERISRGLATFLYPPGPERDRGFSEIIKSYEARGDAVHAGAVPEVEEFHTALRFARAALCKAIELEEVPDIDLLLDRWRDQK